MKYTFLFSTVFFLFGCQATRAPSNSDSPLVSNALYGLWRGEITQFTTELLSDSKNDQVYQLVFSNCGHSPEIWLQQGKTGFHKIYENYKVDSKSGNHILSLIVDSGAWVETQIWTLVSVNTFSASIQWNRMVSNPSLTSDEPFRVFGQMGFGQLSKVSNDCNVWDALERKAKSRK
jgi:hypothetical protein